MEDKLERLKRERDAIVAEIGEFDEEDFRKSGISLEEYSNPTEETIDALVKYIGEEYNQTSIYSE